MANPKPLSVVTLNVSLSATSFNIFEMGSDLGTVSNEVKTPELALMRTTMHNSQIPTITLKDGRAL